MLSTRCYFPVVKILRPWCVVLAVVLLGAACSDDAGDENQASATSDAPVDASGSSDASGADSAPPATDGNASITLGDQVYGFTTVECSTDAFAENNVTGVIDLDGSPTFVEFTVFNEESGLISLTVGLDEEPPRDESLDGSLERGLTAIWNLFYATGDTTVVSDTAIAGTGEFQLVMAIGEGSAGDTVAGAFEADCS